MSPVGRLFFEISADSSKLNASLREAIKPAEEAGVKITRAGQSFISKFDEALNPTRKLAEQINLLSTAGKSQADIWKVMADEINRAAEAAKKNGQAIDPIVKSIQELNKTSLAGRIGFESIGKAVGDFAAHPMESAKTGVSSFLGLLGPTAVGVGAVATGVIAAGAAVYSFAAKAADAAEQIQNLSYATGMTVERVQALQQAGKEKGLGDLTGMIEKLNAQLGGEGGPFSEAILRAGITPKAGADAIYYLEELRKHYAAISKMKQILIVLSVLLFTASVLGQDIQFAWDLSADDSLLGANGGYRLYSSKQSGVYSGAPILTVPPGKTTGSIARPGLGRFYFVATAFDSEGNESAYSNEVTTVIKPKPPTLISAVQAVLSAPAKAVVRFASLFRSNNQLRIVK